MIRVAEADSPMVVCSKCNYTYCSNCQRQVRQVKTAHTMIGRESEQAVGVSWGSGMPI